MIKKFLIFIIFLFGCIVIADEVNTSNNVFDTDNLDYGKYIKSHDEQDLSQEVYDEEQERYTYENYGSSASMEYLNRGDANSYMGGGDFDRNY